MDELNEYLSNIKADNKTEILRRQMEAVLQTLSHVRSTKEINTMCNVFMDEFYVVAEDRGIDL